MIYENDISRLYLVTYTTKFEKQPVTEQFFLEHSETSVNAFSEDFFVHTDTYTTLEEKLSQNENKEGFEKSMEYQTWIVQGFYPWNKIEELKKLASSPNLFFGYLKFDFVHFSKRGIEITHNILWSCRTNNQLRLAEKWFEDHGIHLDAVNDFIYNERNLELIRDFGCSRKVIGDFNIDDKNLGSPLMKMTNTDNGKEYIVVDWQKIQKEIEKILG